MVRALVVLVVTVILATSGVVLFQKVRRDGVGEVLHSLNFKQSGSQIASQDLLSTATALERAHDEDQTYTRADLTKHPNVVLAYASDSNYCIQVIKAEKWYHLVGPGGVPHEGSC